MTNNPKIYLDCAASCSDIKYSIFDGFANSNSTHDYGRKSFAVLENARETLANLIGAKRPSEVIFTSGATEANNIAILGTARAIKNKGNSKIRNKILVSSIEHESALLPAQHLEYEGFEVVLLPVDKNGFLDVNKFRQLCDENTAIVIVQHANTEIGTIQKVKQMCGIAHENGALFHCDCVGSFGWIPVNVVDMGADSASFSGHKIGSPKGIGALYLKSGIDCEPITFGGAQEKGLRPGTQAVALADAFAQAAMDSVENISKKHEHLKNLCKFLIEEIDKIEGVRLTVEMFDASLDFLQNIVHLSFKNLSNKNLILKYAKYGINVSGGPACSSLSDEPSYVLKSIGISDDEINGAIRISFSRKISIEDLQKFICATKAILS